MTNTGCFPTTSDNEIGPISERPLARSLRAAAQSGHTSLPGSTLEPPKPFGQRLV